MKETLYCCVMDTVKQCNTEGLLHFWQIRCSGTRSELQRSPTALHESSASSHCLYGLPGLDRQILKCHSGYFTHSTNHCRKSKTATLFCSVLLFSTWFCFILFWSHLFHFCHVQFCSILLGSVFIPFYYLSLFIHFFFFLLLCFSVFFSGLFSSLLLCFALLYSVYITPPPHYWFHY